MKSKETTYIVTVSTPYGQAHHTVCADHWNDAKTIVTQAYALAKSPGVVLEVDETLPLPIPWPVPTPPPSPTPPATATVTVTEF